MSGLEVQAASEVLDDVRIVHFAEETTLLLKALNDVAGGGIPRGEEDWVQHLGGAGELVKSGIVDGTVGADPEGVMLAFDKMKAAVAEGALESISPGPYGLPWT